MIREPLKHLAGPAGKRLERRRRAAMNLGCFRPQQCHARTAPEKVVPESDDVGARDVDEIVPFKLAQRLFELCFIFFSREREKPPIDLAAQNGCGLKNAPGPWAERRHARLNETGHAEGRVFVAVRSGGARHRQGRTHELL